MSKTQYPIDGVIGKDFKITSEFGWRIHPVENTKKHHNGVDLWGAAGTIYIEAFHGGRVIHAGPSKIKKADGEPGGFGYYVVLRHQIDGKFYTSLYAHLAKGSLKVKVGQKVEPGTVLGKMGATGMVTGKHLHWEIWVGKNHGWTNNGTGFVNPIDFTKALKAKQKALAAAPKATPEDDEVAPAPTHDEVQAKTLDDAYKKAKAQ
jgi:murein DD-endopeptidase MepM/ murein hydrolase activator NlpD